MSLYETSDTIFAFSDLKRAPGYAKIAPGSSLLHVKLVCNFSLVTEYEGDNEFFMLEGGGNLIIMSR